MCTCRLAIKFRVPPSWRCNYSIRNCVVHLLNQSSLYIVCGLPFKFALIMFVFLERDCNVRPICQLPYLLLHLQRRWCPDPKNKIQAVLRTINRGNNDGPSIKSDYTASLEKSGWVILAVIRSRQKLHSCPAYQHRHLAKEHAPWARAGQNYQ